ncbi:uncharacterized protein LOC132057954 [Lycium ferocissimum]|uniref:uncharacterized protein LOC132057954 n=1 Tax=Lycium ferocissimum TaxID=112874 RepID=UPI00281655AF|nr:uncharacterized protein LOC132057954 [Lycium ferocissimum]
MVSEFFLGGFQVFSENPEAAYIIEDLTSSGFEQGRGNGQAESTNKTVIQNLKKKLEDAKGPWSSKQPEVLWAYRATAKSITGETLFSLVYGAEELIMVEVGAYCLRYNWAQEQSNDEGMLVQLNLLEEHRDFAYVRMVAQK